MFLYHVNTFTYHPVQDGMILGRTTGNIVMEEDKKLSGQHVRIMVEVAEGKQQIFVQDLNSKNRTVLDRSEIQPMVKVKVKPHSLLEIGHQKFIFTYQDRLQIADINYIIEEHGRKPIEKLNAQKVVTDIRNRMLRDLAGPNDLERSDYDTIRSLEKKIRENRDKAEMRLRLEQEELMKLEEKKKLLHAQTLDYINQMEAQNKSLESEIMQLQRKIQGIDGGHQDN